MSKQYLCIQKSLTGTCQPQAPSPSEMEAMYSKFNAWKEKFQENIVDLGGRLEDQVKTVKSEGVTDGPFVESKEIIGGYMIISAESFDEAINIVRESPGIGMPGSSVEIREINTP
jgi:hypothetical protein